MASGSESKWKPIGGEQVFPLRMKQAMSGGGESSRKLLASIPTLAVECLKCQKLHLFAELLKPCSNCSSTTYSFGGVPTRVSIICRRCSTDILKSVKCSCGCVNDLTMETMREPDKGCFIATAACGNPNAPEVLVLSHFRDRWLQRSQIGRLFVRIYYSISPTPAAVIAQSGPLRRAVLLLIVKPIAKLIQWFCGIRIAPKTPF